MRLVNPVLRRELVERWRGRRAVATLTGYLAVLGAVLYLLYRVGIATLSSQFGFGLDSATAGPVLGRFLFDCLLFFVLLLVLFVSPGYAAAQLSGERERRTLPLLQMTLLRPHQIVLGKLGAATAWLTLLVAAALPLGAATLFLGGVAVSDLLLGGLFVLIVAVGIAGTAIGISSMVRRTTAAVVLTYATVLALVLGTGFLAIVDAVLSDWEAGGQTTPVALYANPFFGLADAAGAGDSDDAFGLGFGVPSPLSLFAAVHPDGVVFAQEEFADQAVVIGPGPARMPAPVAGDDRRERRPVWLVVAGVHLALGALGLAVATRRVRTGRGVSLRARRRPAPQPSGVAT
jgi:ABC-type transport system involved in multi-copper enzyme maturation permease subunit